MAFDSALDRDYRDGRALLRDLHGGASFDLRLSDGVGKCSGGTVGKEISAVRRVGCGAPFSLYGQQFPGGAGEAGGGRCAAFDAAFGHAGIFPSVFHKIIRLHGSGGGVRSGCVFQQSALLYSGGCGHGGLRAGLVAAVAVQLIRRDDLSSDAFVRRGIEPYINPGVPMGIFAGGLRHVF